MNKQRRKRLPEFKARVALKAIKGVKTVSQISQAYKIHSVMVSEWKKEMLDHLYTDYPSTVSRRMSSYPRR